MKKALTAILFNILIVASAVILIKASAVISDPVTVIAAVIAAVLFITVNIKIFFVKKDETQMGLFSGKKKKDKKNTVTPEQEMEAILKGLSHSVYFGDLARTSIDQLHRVCKCRDRAIAVVNDKFTAGSITADRYAGTIVNAADAAIENLRGVASRFRLFDDAEYRKLRNYKHDNIPDDIQEEQIALYAKNLEFIRNSIAMNEQLILKIDFMATEIADTSEQDGKATDSVAQEITELTQQLRFYQR